MFFFPGDEEFVPQFLPAGMDTLEHGCASKEVSMPKVERSV
jgi:hypothetical protein